MASALRPPDRGQALADSAEAPACTVQNVISTSTVFAASLERLNRLSIVHLLEQLVQEVDHHCQSFDAKTTQKVNALRSELLALLAALPETIIQQHHREHHQQPPPHGKPATDDLTAAQLKQVEALLLKLLGDYNLAPLVGRVNIRVGGRVFVLSRLLEVLATADKVVDTHIDYNDTDIVGARLVLADQTQVAFVCSRHEDPKSRQFQYIFQTSDWKGLKARFVLGFARRNTELQLCGRAIVLANYDGVYQSNIKFELCD